MKRSGTFPGQKAGDSMVVKLTRSADDPTDTCSPVVIFYVRVDYETKA